MLNKRGIGTTLTWIVATFVIFFLLVGIYLPSTFVIAGKKLKELGKAEVEFEKDRDLITQENFIGFLATPIEINGGAKIIGEMFSEYHFSDKRYKEELEKEFSNFFDPLQYCFKEGARKFYYRAYLLQVAENEKEELGVLKWPYFSSSKLSWPSDKELIASQTLSYGKGSFTVKLYKGVSEHFYDIGLVECEGRKEEFYFD